MVSASVPELREVRRTLPKYRKRLSDPNSISAEAVPRFNISDRHRIFSRDAAERIPGTYGVIYR